MSSVGQCCPVCLLKVKQNMQFAVYAAELISFPLRSEMERYSGLLLPFEMWHFLKLLPY